MSPLHTAVLIFLLPIPFFHLLLHAFLPFWRRHPLLTYAMGAVLWIAAAVLAALVRDATWQIYSPPSWLAAPSISIGAIGAFLATWSIATIGPRRFLVWAVLKPENTEQKYIPSGPFRFLSHPAYTGYLLVWFALAIGTGYVVFVVSCVLAAMLFPIVVRLENNELHERVG
ncbi:MAG: hypothetical protein HYV34_01895 [Candidatus Kerfeldbacteria bacterium]|nr:hypothetical protein [Candidatus Kerfeldbacteria bacterium]